MPNAKGLEKIIIVDDEWESPIVTAVRRRLDEEGWRTLRHSTGSRWVYR